MSNAILYVRNIRRLNKQEKEVAELLSKEGIPFETQYNFYQSSEPIVKTCHGSMYMGMSDIKKYCPRWLK